MSGWEPGDGWSGEPWYVEALLWVLETLVAPVIFPVARFFFGLPEPLRGVVLLGVVAVWLWCWWVWAGRLRRVLVEERRVVVESVEEDGDSE